MVAPITTSHFVQFCLRTDFYFAYVSVAHAVAQSQTRHQLQIAPTKPAGETRQCERGENQREFNREDEHLG